MFAKEACDRFKRVGAEIVICVEPADDIACDHLEGFVESVSLSGVLL
jgi:hypothetical protein